MSSISTKTNIISDDEILRQQEFSGRVCEHYSERYKNPPLAYVHVYGCQQNVSDGERIKGMLSEMGFLICEESENADLILFVTCAVREHAEDRVFGNVGALKNHKINKPNSIIGLCGCMVQQPHIAEKIKKSYSQVDLVFGTHVIHRLPEFIYNILSNRRKMIIIPESSGVIAEGLPVCREKGVKGWLPIMYGCNNFCTYCIVPYVRGRERSRTKEDIIAEAKSLIAAGYKNITLLGQNVNSYGKTLDEPISFASLLRSINDLDGDFIVRFMTSHPKDCNEELLKTMSECEKVAKHLHLPVQSGSNRILKAMNRNYTREHYLSLVETARKYMPTISITSDIIVGFPGECYEDFCETIDLIEKVKYTSLFTFNYSPRVGTPAAKMPMTVSEDENKQWFNELKKRQEKIATEISAMMVGQKLRILCENETKTNGVLEGRTEGNVIVEFEGERALIGNFVNIEIVSAKTWVLNGRLL